MAPAACGVLYFTARAVIAFEAGPSTSIVSEAVRRTGAAGGLMRE